MGYKQVTPIPVATGGTGATTFTSNGALLGNGTSAITATAAGTDGQVIIGSTGMAPAFATLTSTGGTVTFTPGPNTLNLEASGMAGGILTTTYIANDTWTKDANTVRVQVVMVGGGGGGGSGRRGASTAAGGGGGGSNGRTLTIWGAESIFGATESVVVGTGGAGGASQTADNTNGNVGSPGIASSFGSYSAQGGLGGSGGNTSITSGGTGRASSYMTQDFLVTTVGGESGGQGSNEAALPVTSILQVASSTSGGGGGGADTGTARNGSNGGNITQPYAGGATFQSGGAGGIESGTINGANGINGVFNTGGFIYGGLGGGGGGGQSAGGVSGTGGDGGLIGGAGGGGGGSINGTNSGSGGAGGRGIVMVIEYF